MSEARIQAVRIKLSRTIYSTQLHKPVIHDVIKEYNFVLPKLNTE